MEGIIDMVCAAHKGRDFDTTEKYYVYWETTRDMQIKDKSTVTKGQNFRLGSAIWFLTDGTAVIYLFHNRINSVTFPAMLWARCVTAGFSPKLTLTYHHLKIVSTML
jgi:hypothetical protein